MKSELADIWREGKFPIKTENIEENNLIILPESGAVAFEFK